MYADLIEQLMRHERFVSKPYRDTVGKLTIGFGRNIDDEGISQEEALVLMKNDVDRCWYELSTNFEYWDHLEPLRKNVLVNMCYNLGLSKLLLFRRMWTALYVNDYESAAAEMLDSKWARQVGDRARELADQMRTG